MDKNIIIKIENLNVWFGQVTALKNINLEIYNNEIISAIGPANSGKTTFLRTLNRLNKFNSSYRSSGSILLNGKNIEELDDTLVRKKIGIIFAMPQVLPVSIFDNVAYGPKVNGINNKKEIQHIVEESMKKAAIWDEIKDRLNSPAVRLSGGQQQRLCLARTLAVEPDIILYDEPCSGLDPISTAKVEETIRNLKTTYTQILVTNNTKQAARVSERCAFFLMGELVELAKTDIIFTAPSDKRTEDYVSGRFG